jgi:hypothetical protein
MRCSGDVAAAWPPKARQPYKHVTVWCAVGPQPCRRSAPTPGPRRAVPPRPSGVIPASKVSIGRLREERLLELSLDQKLLEESVLLLQLGQSLGILSLHGSVLLLPAVTGRLDDLNSTADIDSSRALSDQLLSGFELADSPLGRVADSFDGEDARSVRPDADSHSPWTDLLEPRQ